MTILTREQIDEWDHLNVGEVTTPFSGLFDTARAYHDALDLIVDLVNQHCYREADGSYDTAALSTNRDAFDFLVRAGRAEYVGERYGRRAFIRLLDDNESEKETS